MSARTRINKAGDEGSSKVFRLTDIEPEFVSLVRAGANRQRSFQVIKADGMLVCDSCGYKVAQPEDGTTQMACPKCDGGTMKLVQSEKDDDPIPEDFDEDGFVEYLAKLTGSPRNRFGTHSSYKFKGDYAKAWKLHFSQHAGGKPDATSTGPLRGTVRRVEMIAGAMKPACKLPTTDQIEARSGDPSPLTGKYPETPGDYGLSKWDEPANDADREGMKFSCGDLEVIKRAALAEIKRRAEDAAAEESKNGDADGQAHTDKTGGNEGDGDNADGGSTEGGGADLSSWLDEAGAEVETLSLDIAIQRALDGQSDSGAAPEKPPAQKAQIGDTGAPPVVAEGEATEEDESEKDAQIAKLEAELNKARSELKKARREITSLKAKAARLAKGVGQSSVMLTGEVTAKGMQQSDNDNEGPSKGAFASGGDIAACVTQDEG